MTSIHLCRTLKAYEHDIQTHAHINIFVAESDPNKLKISSSPNETCRAVFLARRYDNHLSSEWLPAQEK